MTIHNLAYQGIFPGSSLAVLGIPEHLFRIDGVEFYGNANVLKGGILSADAVSTVSVRYSREIQTPEFGAGLEDVLRGRAGSLHGILNGIDVETWNPETDPYLPANFSSGNMAGKALCRKALLESFGLPGDSPGPLLATIARLVDQKGFDLIAAVMPEVLEAGATYILLGSGDSHYHTVFTDLAARYPDRLSVKIAYDEALAHQVEGGADFFLMPSRFEPCGLNQMYSLRYGTVPIVRATGGLDDTIQNYDPASGCGNGLKFAEYTPEALSMKIHEAMLIHGKEQHMKRLVANAMDCDFSWDRAASEYLSLYRSLQSG
jgi:starch synthase